MNHSPRSRYRRARGAVVALAPLLCLAALCWPPAFAQSAPVTYQVIARTGDAAPGTGPGVTFAPGVNSNTFELPGIGPTGAVVFGGFLAGPGVNASNDSALFSGPGGAISLLARSGAPAPDTGTNYGSLWKYPFASFPIRADGRVLFAAPLAGRLGDDGLFVGAPGAVTLVGRSGQQAPDAEPGVRFESSFALNSRHFALNNAGQVAFEVSLTGPGPRDSSFGLFSGAPGSLRLAARSGTPAPGAGGDTFLPQFSLPAINAAGAVAVTARLARTEGEGIWLGQPGALEPVVRTGAPAPGTTGTFTGLLFPSVSYTAINDRNEVAFIARESDGQSDASGIWAGPAGSPELVALSGRPAPGAGAVFSGFGETPPAINNRGQVAFRMNVRPGADLQGIWAGSPGALELVALQGQAAALGPGSPGARFSRFGPAILNDAGQVAFHALLESDDQTFSGWSYWVTDPSGGLRLVAREGGLLDLGGGNLVTIAKLPDVFDQDGAFKSLGTESGHGWLFFNDAGQLVFRAQLGDGTQAIIVATVPEPGAVTGLAVSALLLLRRRRGS